MLAVQELPLMNSNLLLSPAAASTRTPLKLVWQVGRVWRKAQNQFATLFTYFVSGSWASTTARAKGGARAFPRRFIDLPVDF